MSVTFLLRYTSNILTVHEHIYLLNLQIYEGLILFCCEIPRILVILLTMPAFKNCSPSLEMFYHVKLLKMRMGLAEVMGSFNLHHKNQQMQQLRTSMAPFSMIGNCMYMSFNYLYYMY